MSELKWIPVPADRYLPPGAYWVLWKDNHRQVVVWACRNRLHSEVTHYCPTPEPVMPVPHPEPVMPEPEISPCPWCGTSALISADTEKPSFAVYCSRRWEDCGARGPVRTTKDEAIDAWYQVVHARCEEAQAKYKKRETND
jgi:hypothetical protein